MELKELRKKIDGIDEEIVALLKKRMEVSAEIGRKKADGDINIYDEKREKEVMARVVDMAGKGFDIYMKMMYASIFEASKSYQRQFKKSEAGSGKEKSEL